MKNILITGASRGIGRAIALKFSKNGNRIFINYKSDEISAREVKELSEKKGAQAVLVPFDVSNYQEVKAALSEIHSIDILVNNAGISYTSLFQDLSLENWQELWQTNVSGMIFTTQEAVKKMLGKKSGVIINISSVWGISGAATEVQYSATKGAVISASRALAKELAPSGIRVNAVAPGAVRTDMVKLSPLDEKTLIEETPLGRMGTAEEIAELVHYLCSDSASFITGQVVSPNGGLVI